MAAEEKTPRTSLHTVAGWKLGKTLGRGAYAHVRLATHPNGSRAACKILPALRRPRTLPATWDETIDAVEAHKEVVFLKALAGAGIKGIVGLEGVVEEGGWTYVFLTLHDTSASNVPVPWKKDSVVPFFRRLCLTIHSLHQLGISHEDLKRSNILLDSAGRPVVVDFGFSHFTPHGTLVRSAGGTLDYSSPEKVNDDLYDPRANDVWALGILLTKLLGLPHPFMTSTGRKEQSEYFRHRILHQQPRLPRDSTDASSSVLTDLLRGMLEKRPQDRLTLPEVLRHPFFGVLKPAPIFRLPSTRLPEDFPTPMPTSVLEDVCFLAYLNKEFYLCESFKRVKEAIMGPGTCWEKRWAGLLSKWTQKTETEWEDVPRVRAGVDSDARRSAMNARSRALREIHLSPNQARPAVKRLDVLKAAGAGSGSNLGDDNKAPLPLGLTLSATTPLRPRKALITQMKGRDSSVSSARSVIDVQISQRLVIPAKLRTPARVNFGRKKPGVVLPKLGRPDIADLRAIMADVDQPSTPPTYASGGAPSSRSSSPRGLDESSPSEDEPDLHKTGAPTRGIGRGRGKAPSHSATRIEVAGQRRSERIKAKVAKV